MSSLHDLIYSQTPSEAETLVFSQSQSEADTLMFSESQQQAERDTSASSLPLKSPSRDSHKDNDANILEDHYLFESPSPSPKKKTVTSTPRSHKKRKRPLRYTRDNDDNISEEEDPEERKLRLKRQRRKDALRAVQQRWKKKTISLENEVDVGGAIEYTARRVWRRKLQQQREAAYITDIPPEEEKEKDEDGSVSSEEMRQQSQLGSLWTHVSQQEQEELVASQQELLDGDEEDEEEEEEQDYFQLGYAAPRWKDLEEFYIYKQDPKFVFTGVKWKERLERKEQIEKEGVTLPPVRLNTDHLPEPRYYVKIPRPTECFTRPSFFHQRAFRTLAIRYLVASCEADTTDGGRGFSKQQHRLLQHLATLPLREVGREFFVLSQAKERGLDHILFQSHIWNDRSFVAKALGLSQQPPGVGPPVQMGYSLEPKAVTNVARNYRAKLVRLMGNGKIEAVLSSPPKDGVASVGVNKESDNSGAELKVPGHDGDAGDETDARMTISPVLESGGEGAKPAAENSETPVAKHSLPRPHDRDDSFFIEFGSRSSDYIHRPGTTPPIPQFPLDETNIIFGGPDQFSRVHHKANMDEAVYKVILSTLLARLYTARSEADDAAVEKAQRIVVAFLDQAMKKNVLGLSQMSHFRRKRAEQPSKLHYMSMMGFCSFLANSGGLHPSIFESVDLSAQQGTANKERTYSEDESDQEEEQMLGHGIDSKNNSRVPDMKRTAQLIYEKCKGVPESPSLTLFPRIHTTTGVALIASHLPSAAAEILSRPLDDKFFRTPFDLMRSTLEYLERNKFLVESQKMESSSGGKLVNVGHLEHIIHQATAIWRRCIEIEPSEPNHRGWYLSGLAASLLLCSGNEIGSHGYPSPSTKTSQANYDALFSQGSTEDHTMLGVHEIRQKMSKFQTTRSDLVLAVRSLVDTATTQPFSRLYLTISSVLEWKQVVALLVGPSHDSGWCDVRRLHAHHTVQWALEEKSHPALWHAEQLCEKQEATPDCVLSVLAGMLENNPSDLGRWRRMVRALGPVGARVSKRRRKHCKSTKCHPCGRLRRGLNVDHVEMEKKNTELGWWGETRRSWWLRHLLNLSQAREALEDTIGIQPTCAAIEKRLRRELPALQVSAQRRKTSISGVGPRRQQEMNLDWLSTVEQTSSAQNQVVNDLDSLLPPSFAETLNRHKENEADLTCCLITDLENHELEMVSYKVLITCHLFDASHELVQKGVWFLAKVARSKEYMLYRMRKRKRSVEKNTSDKDAIEKKDAWRCIVWLSSWGLHIPQILHDLFVATAKAYTSTLPERQSTGSQASTRIIRQKRTTVTPPPRADSNNFPLAAVTAAFGQTTDQPIDVEGKVFTKTYRKGESMVERNQRRRQMTNLQLILSEEMIQSDPLNEGLKCLRILLPDKGRIFDTHFIDQLRTFEWNAIATKFFQLTPQEIEGGNYSVNPRDGRVNRSSNSTTEGPDNRPTTEAPLLVFPIFSGHVKHGHFWFVIRERNGDGKITFYNGDTANWKQATKDQETVKHLFRETTLWDHTEGMTRWCNLKLPEQTNLECGSRTFANIFRYLKARENDEEIFQAHDSKISMHLEEGTVETLGRSARQFLHDTIVEKRIPASAELTMQALSVLNHGTVIKSH